jgi:hypothetical protein
MPKNNSTGRFAEILTMNGSSMTVGSPVVLSM